MMQSRKHFLSGQTLLELIVTIGVVAIIVTGLVVAVTSSLRFGQSSRLRSQSVQYAQEGIELVRKIRDTQPWDTLMTYAGKSWCLDSSGTWTADTGSCPLIDGAFTRRVSLTWNDPLMNVVSSVQWTEGSSQQSMELQTYLTQWR